MAAIALWLRARVTGAHGGATDVDGARRTGRVAASRPRTDCRAGTIAGTAQPRAAHEAVQPACRRRRRDGWGRKWAVEANVRHFVLFFFLLEGGLSIYQSIQYYCALFCIASRKTLFLLLVYKTPHCLFFARPAPPTTLAARHTRFVLEPVGVSNESVKKGGKTK